MNWVPGDRALARLALAVLNSAIADRDAAFVASPYVAGYCQLAGVPLARYRAAYAGRADRSVDAAADAAGPSPSCPVADRAASGRRQAVTL